MLARRLQRAVITLVVVTAIGRTVYAEPAEELVNRLVEATKSLNYDGIFVYQRDALVDAMRIIHKHADGAESERLLSLSGPPREVIRDGARVTCTFADDKAVMVEKRQPSDFYSLALSQPVERLVSNYAFALEGEDRVAGRATHVVGISPRGSDRYGYRLWIDKASNLLLKSVILDREGRALEQMQFTQIQIGHEISEALLKAEVDGVGFTWYTNSTVSEGADERTASEDWKVDWLPNGFEMRNHQVQHMAASKMPVKHMVYSDGLAIVSVFVEKLMDDATPLQGYSSMGAVNAFSRVADDYQITVVGEVPQPTVRQIASSVSFHKP